MNMAAACAAAVIVSGTYIYMYMYVYTNALYIYIYVYTYSYTNVYICSYTYVHMYIYAYIWQQLVQLRFRPTQSIMCVPLQVNRFQKRILLIVQYKYLESCSGDFYSPESDPPHKIMRYWFYYSI